MKQSFLLRHLERLQKLQDWPDADVVIHSQVNEYIPWLCGLPFDYLFTEDPVAMAECSLLVQEYLGIDILAINLDVYNFEGESLGAEMRYYKDHIPDFDRSDYLIKSEADLDRLDFYGLDSGRYPYLTNYYEAYKKYTGVIQEPCLSAPWTLACNLYGLDRLVMAAVENPDFVHRLMERIVKRVHIPLFKALHEKYPEIQSIGLADAFASPPMVNMDMISEFIYPYLKEEFEACAEMGMGMSDAGIWGFSALGEAEREGFCDFMKFAGGGSLRALDPDPEKLGPEYFREKADARQCGLSMGLSTSFLQSAEPEEVADRVKRYVLAGKNGKTLYLMCFNNIAPDTPIQNITAAVSAVRIYGKAGATGDEVLTVPPAADFREFLKEKRQNNVEGYTFRWLERSSIRL